MERTNTEPAEAQVSVPEYGGPKGTCKKIKNKEKCKVSGAHEQPNERSLNSMNMVTCF